MKAVGLKRLQACILKGSRPVGSQFNKLYNIIHAILIGNDDLCNLFNFDENKSSFLTSENLAVQFLRLVPLQSECYHSDCLTLERLTTGSCFFSEE